MKLIVTKVNMNLQRHQDRKYIYLNLHILEDNLHVEYTIFMFSLSVRYVMCLYLSQSWHFLCIILATALLFQARDININIFLIKRHEYASISLIIQVVGFSPVWMKRNLVLLYVHGFDVFW